VHSLVSCKAAHWTPARHAISSTSACLSALPRPRTFHVATLIVCPFWGGLSPLTSDTAGAPSPRSTRTKRGNRISIARRLVLALGRLLRFAAPAADALVGVFLHSALPAGLLLTAALRLAAGSFGQVRTVFVALLTLRPSDVLLPVTLKKCSSFSDLGPHALCDLRARVLLFSASPTHIDDDNVPARVHSPAHTGAPTHFLKNRTVPRRSTSSSVVAVHSPSFQCIHWPPASLTQAVQ